MLTSTRRANTERAGIESIAFDRRKYGLDLPVDASELQALPKYITGPRPHRLQFFEIVLLRGGRGSVDMDGQNLTVRRARVLFACPGEVRCWRLDARLDGQVVCLTPDVFDEFFADAGFVERLPFFDTASHCRSIDLAPATWTRAQAIVEAMIDELGALRRDSLHILRALLYQLLVALAREVPMAAITVVPPGLPQRFRLLVERQHRQVQQVQAYAAQLGVSPGHLNTRLRAAFGVGASRLIQQRRYLEARRLLLYGRDNVTAVAAQLGFRDASYFNRFFQRLAGCTPREFRRSFGQHSEIGEK